MSSAAKPHRDATAIYVASSVVTMDDRYPTDSAVAIRGERILAVGSKGDVLDEFVGSATDIIDLSGKTLLPGFIDPHTHGLAYGQDVVQSVNLRCPPLGRVDSFQKMVSAVQGEVEATPEGQWVLGARFDEFAFTDAKQLPTRTDLDAISNRHPILLTHRSGHTAVANSMALEFAGIRDDSQDPAGGSYRRTGSEHVPDGVLLGRGAVHAVLGIVPPPDDEAWMDILSLVQRDHLMSGITSTHDARVSGRAARAYQMASAAGRLPIRTTMFLDVDTAFDSDGIAPFFTGFGNDRLRVGAVKLYADGSVPGFTGWLTEPYLTSPTADSDYRGGPTTPPTQLIELVTRAHTQGFQVAIHAGGDAGIDSAIDAIRTAQELAPRPDARHRIEHCHCPRDDQLDAMAELGISPSFFIGHTYYWGDRYVERVLGPERSARISPLRSAANHGLRFSLHSDSPHVPANPLRDVWSAIARTTSNGRVLGPDERLTVIEALRAITIDAAWQGFAEDDLGSITPGKLADFTILDANPLTVSADEIRDISVEEVVINGEPVYKKDADWWVKKFDDIA